MDNIVKKVIRKIRKTGRKVSQHLYKPVPIFVLHQVGNDFNPLVDNSHIWSSMELFRQNIEVIQNKYKIITLEKANRLIAYPILLRRYAVITFDDGYQSTLNAVNYLIGKKIPCTWFINTAYLDQKSFSLVDADVYLNHCKERNQALIDLVEKTKQATNEDEYLLLESQVLSQTDLSSVIPKLYITREQLFSMTSPYLSIGLHGHSHLAARCLTMKTFQKNIEQNKELLKSHPRFVPFFALPYGAYTQEQADYLIQTGLPTLLCDKDIIHTKYPLLSRYCLDGVDVNTIK